jgi:hypothetical protein
MLKMVLELNRTIPKHMNMKKHIITWGLVAVTIGITACSTAPVPETKMEQQVDNALSELNTAKKDAATTMRTLHEKLAIRLVKVDARLDEPGISEVQREEWKKTRIELKDQMKRLEDGIGEVEGSTDTTWEQVREGTRRTTTDVDNWFQRQAEIIDQKTGMDNDKDGH